jgi:hypothetical protein
VDWFNFDRIADFVPGTKVTIQDFDIASGVVLLKEENIANICGEVEELKESWIVQQRLQTIRSFDTSNAASLAPGEDPPPKFGALVLSSLKKEKNESKKDLENKTSKPSQLSAAPKKKGDRKNSEKSNDEMKSNSQGKKHNSSSKSTARIDAGKIQEGSTRENVPKDYDLKHKEKSAQKTKDANVKQTEVKKVDKNEPRRIQISQKHVQEHKGDEKPPRKSSLSHRKDENHSKASFRSENTSSIHVQEEHIREMKTPMVSIEASLASLSLDSTPQNSSKSKKSQIWKPKSKPNQ